MKRRQIMTKDRRVEIYDASGNKVFKTLYLSGSPNVSAADDGATTLYSNGSAVGMRSSKSEWLTGSLEIQATVDEEDKLSDNPSPMNAFLTNDPAELPDGWTPFDSPHADRKVCNAGIRILTDMGTYWRVRDYHEAYLKVEESGDGKWKVDYQAVGSSTFTGFPDSYKIAKEESTIL